MKRYSVLYKLVKDIFTETDNNTFDFVRILASIAVIVGLYLQVYSIVIQQHVFDMNTFGIGVAALFAGLAAALGFKKETTSIDNSSDKEKKE